MLHPEETSAGNVTHRRFMERENPGRPNDPGPAGTTSGPAPRPVSPPPGSVNRAGAAGGRRLLETLPQTRGRGGEKTGGAECPPRESAVWLFPGRRRSYSAACWWRLITTNPPPPRIYSKDRSSDTFTVALFETIKIPNTTQLVM